MPDEPIEPDPANDEASKPRSTPSDPTDGTAAAAAAAAAAFPGETLPPEDSPSQPPQEDQHATVVAPDVPRKRRHRVRNAITLVVVLALVAGAIGTFLAERAHPEYAKPLNASGRDRAVVLYQPGLTDFEHNVADAFAVGLVNAGWSAETVTAGGKAPLDATDYKLIVVSSPSYWWEPARPVTRWIDDVTNLRNKQVVVMGSGSRIFGSPTSALAAKLRKHDADVTKTLTVYSWKSSNPEMSGDPEDIAKSVAYSTGSNLVPPTTPLTLTGP